MRSCAIDSSAAKLTAASARREYARTLLRPARCLWSSIFMLSTTMLAAAPPAGSLQIVQAWSRATAPGASVGVAYFKIVNSGDEDKLIHIEAPVARQAQMHSMAIVGGIMQMRELLSVDVPAKGRVRFEPGGLHVMLVDLLRPLKKASGSR